MNFYDSLRLQEKYTNLEEIYITFKDGGDQEYRNKKNILYTLEVYPSSYIVRDGDGVYIDIYERTGISSISMKKHKMEEIDCEGI